jgi:hypothetical protein
VAADADVGADDQPDRLTVSERDQPAAAGVPAGELGAEVSALRQHRDRAALRELRGGGMTDIEGLIARDANGEDVFLADAMAAVRTLAAQVAERDARIAGARRQAFEEARKAVTAALILKPSWDRVRRTAEMAIEALADTPAPPMVETQPGSPWFDGAAAYESYCDARDPIEDGQAECQKCGEWYRITSPSVPHVCAPPMEETD